MSKNVIGLDEHVLITGMPGTGKSYFAEHYLRSYENVVKLDTKREVDERRRDGKSVWDGLEENKDFTVVEHLAQLPDVATKKIIYAPVFEEMEIDFYNEFFKWCFLRGNTVIWVDELMSVGSASNYPVYLKAVMTQGRSKFVTCWALTQRPTSIPAIVPANCTHFIEYALMLEQDRKKMSDMTGAPEFMNRLGKYQFWYFKIGMEHAIPAILVDGDRG